MNLLILVLAFVGLTALAWLAVALVDALAHDGRGRTGSVPPPRSRPADLFEPHTL